MKAHKRDVLVLKHLEKIGGNREIDYDVIPCEPPTFKLFEGPFIDLNQTTKYHGLKVRIEVGSSLD